MEGKFHSHLVHLRNFWLETDHKKFTDLTKISTLGRGGVPRSAYRKNGEAAEAAPPMATGHESLETEIFQVGEFRNDSHRYLDGGNSNISYFHPALEPGEMIQVDDFGYSWIGVVQPPTRYLF